jgi:integrase
VSIRVYKQGSILVDARWPDGQRTRTRMPDRTTAEKINKKIEVAVVDEERIWRKLRKELRLEQGQILTFSDLADQYLNQYVKSYNRDIRVKKSRLEVLKTFYAKERIESVGPRSVALFVASKRKEGVKNATINRYLAVLRHMMTWAVGQGILETSLMGKIEKLNEQEWIGTRPDESLIESVFSKVDSRIKPIFVFLRETGCRRGEAIGLKLSQIDFARQIVTIHGETKSGRSRQVPLTEQAIWAVQALPVQGSTVFYHPDYLKPFTGDGLGWFWDKARGETKLRIHDLRHAFAIRLAEDGCPMHYISEVMGHHSLEFTRRRYARFSPESASKAVLRVLQGRKAAVGAQNGHGIG